MDWQPGRQIHWSAANKQQEVFVNLRHYAVKSVVSKSFLVAAGIACSVFSGTNASACSTEDYIGSICVVPYTRGCPSGYVAADGRILNIQAYTALYSLVGNVFGGDGRTTFGVPDLRGRVVVGTGVAVSPYTSQVTLGQKRGQESVTLNANNVPAHTHSATFAATSGQVPVTIPAQAASGAITATAVTDIVPGAPGSIDPAPNVHNYYLTGVAGTGSGTVTVTIPGSDKSTLNGTRVTVDSSNYKSGTSAQTVNVNTVTGGTVTVAPNPSTNAPVATLPPELGLTYCIATTGIYPSFD